MVLSNEAIATEQICDFASDAMLDDVLSQEHKSLLRNFRKIGRDAGFEMLAIGLSQAIGMSEPHVYFFLGRRLNQHAMERNDFIDPQRVKSFLRSWTKGVNNG